MASPRAVDSWQDEGVHFFVFQLHPVQGAAAVPNDPPVVVFAMHPEEPAPVSAVVVTPRPGGEEAEVVDLRQPDGAYVAAYAGARASAQAPDPANDPGAVEEATEAAPIDTAQPEPVAEAEALPAGEHELIFEAEQVNGDAPDVNLALLAAVRESHEFQAIQGRLAKLLPTDTWQEDDAHFLVFQLLPADQSSSDGHEPPVAVFAMRLPEPAPISAVIVTPSADGQQAEVLDLRNPANPYVAPIGS